MARPGERVGALLDEADGVVRLFGFGVYVGDEVPHEKVAGHGPWLREADAPNPKILLDDGKDVFGCECWWGSEAKLRTLIAGKKVVQVDIDQIRLGELAPKG